MAMHVSRTHNAAQSVGLYLLAIKDKFIISHEYANCVVYALEFYIFCLSAIGFASSGWEFCKIYHASIGKTYLWL